MRLADAFTIAYCTKTSAINVDPDMWTDRSLREEGFKHQSWDCRRKHR
jgi:hypothetical protein